MTNIMRVLRQFREDRGFMKYHTPKNLAMALSVEASELCEIYQWKDGRDELGEDDVTRTREEVADVLIYALNICDVLGIDPDDCVREKIIINEAKYPASVPRNAT